MNPAEADAQAPSPVAACAVNASSMPSQIVSPSRSFGGARTIGHLRGLPIVSLTGSALALPLPSGFNKVRCTALTLRGDARTPGSGSSTKEKAAISAGCCSGFAGGRNANVGGSVPG